MTRKRREVDADDDQIRRGWEQRTIEKSLAEMRPALREHARRRVLQKQREELPDRIARELALVERDFKRFERVRRGFQPCCSDLHSYQCECDECE